MLLRLGFQTFGVKLVSYVAGAVVSVMVARALGPHERGIWSVALLTASILALLADGGLTTSALFVLRNWPGRSRAAVRMSLGFVLLGAAAWAGTTLVLGRRGWLGVKGVSPDVAWLVAMASLLIPTTGLVRQLLTGLGDLSGANGSLLVQALLLPAALVAAILGAGATAAVALRAYLAALGITLLAALGRLGSRSLSGPSWDPHLTRPLVTYGLRSQIGALALYLAYRSDLFLVDRALGTSAAGIYSVALTLSEMLRGVAETGQALVLSRATREDLRSHAERVARCAALATAGAGLALGGASLFLVPLAFGERYRGATPAFACLVPGVVGLAVSYAVSPLLFLEGRVMVSVAAALAALVALWVVGLWGPGAISLTKVASASSLAYWVLAAIQIVHLHRCGRLRAGTLVPGWEDLAAIWNALLELVASRRRPAGGGTRLPVDTQRGE